MSLRVHKAQASDVGSCNFCHDNHRVVYVVSGDETTLVVRFCRKCLSLLDKAKYI